MCLNFSNQLDYHILKFAKPQPKNFFIIYKSMFATKLKFSLITQIHFDDLNFGNFK
jgi:hypothetical protein